MSQCSDTSTDAAGARAPKNESKAELKTSESTTNCKEVLAGSVATMPLCVQNFLAFTNAGIVKVIQLRITRLF
jgi:hypothetical protein